MGFSEAFHLPLLGPESALGHVYGFVKDVVLLGALVGVAGFLWRRLVTKPDRVTLSTEGVVILLFIAGLMVTDLLFEGSLILARGDSGSAWEPAAALGRALLAPLAPWQARAVGLLSFWLHLAIILALPERPALREALPHHHRAAERLLRAAPARRARSASSTSRRRTRASAPRR